MSLGVLRLIPSLRRAFAREQPGRAFRCKSSPDYRLWAFRCNRSRGTRSTTYLEVPQVLAMAFKSDKPEITYLQVAELALSLSTKDQIKLAEDLQRAVLKARWDEIPQA